VWTCLRFTFDAPAEPNPSFDPSAILDVGVLFWGYDDLVILVDDVWY
jgi:hypothetical protein